MDPVPLVLDMDGTFFATDSSELMTAQLRRWRPHRRLGLRRRVQAGDKAEMKRYLLRHGRVPLARFVLNEELVSWARAQAGRGRRVYLATGAPQELADAVLAAHPWLAGAFGTRPGHNNTGSRKAADLVARFGERGFDYAGNSEADLAVWAVARAAVVCSSSSALVEAAGERADVVAVFS